MTTKPPTTAQLKRKIERLEADKEMRQFRELAALRVALKEAQEVINWALEQQT